jgi:hypothetical protein
MMKGDLMEWRRAKHKADSISEKQGRLALRGEGKKKEKRGKKIQCPPLEEPGAGRGFGHTR